MECGSPGNPKGVHQSGSGAAEAMIAPQECKETLDQVVGNAEGQRWSVGRKGEGETGRKEDGVGMVQETTARGGGGKSWNVSQVAIPALQFQDEGVCHQCSDHQRPAGEHTCDAVILSHTHPTSRNYAHILHRVTPHRLGMGVWLLYPVVG